MNTIEIIKSLSKFYLTKKNFIGVYPIDLIPKKKIKKPFSLICNTDDSTKPGSHWIALYAPKYGNIEYFDSFGFKPMNEEIIVFINLNGIKYRYNKKQIQSNKSITCGKFCVLFIYFRSKNITFDKFLNLFSSNKLYNEKLLKKLFSKIVNI